MHVSHGREAFGGDAGALAPKRDVMDDSFSRCTDRAGIDQLAASQAIRVGATAGNDLAADDRDEVGGGRADVD